MHITLNFRHLLAGAVLIIGAVDTSAQSMNWRKHGAPSWATPADIEAEKHLRHLSMYMSDRTRTAEGVYWSHTAIARVVLAADVQVHSPLSPEEKEQVRKMWIRFEEQDLLICNSLQFDVVNGSLLKYAVCSLFDEFVYFSADLKLGLEKIDKQDGRTVLDYIQDKIDALNPDSALRPTLQHYYDILRKAGAKHRKEVRGGP